MLIISAASTPGQVRLRWVISESAPGMGTFTEGKVCGLQHVSSRAREAERCKRDIRGVTGRRECLGVVAGAVRDNFNYPSYVHLNSKETAFLGFQEIKQTREREKGKC